MQIVGIGNFLAVVLMAAAVLIIHHRPTLMHLQFDEQMPDGSVNFVKVDAAASIKQYARIASASYLCSPIKAVFLSYGFLRVPDSL